MPLYTVSHHTHLSSSQQDELAASITTIHTTLFTTPFLFVNVRFEHLDLHSYFVAGKRVIPSPLPFPVPIPKL
jgi:phenylpyruvate tautomerase PptA (4-oxalocrotonate tautomerase family)